MWIELHDSARQHPKVLRLSRDIDETWAHALGHVCALWTWTLQMAPDGDLSSFEPEDVEFGCGWEGEPGLLYDSMVRRGIIRDDGDSVSVHDWWDYAGSLKVASRKREQRKRKRYSVSGGVSQDSPGTVQGQSSDCHEDRQTDRQTDRQKERKTSRARAREAPRSQPTSGSGEGSQPSPCPISDLVSEEAIQHATQADQSTPRSGDPPALHQDHRGGYTVELQELRREWAAMWKVDEVDVPMPTHDTLSRWRQALSDQRAGQTPAQRIDTAMRAIRGHRRLASKDGSPLGREMRSVIPPAQIGGRRRTDKLDWDRYLAFAANGRTKRRAKAEGATPMPEHVQQEIEQQNREAEAAARAAGLESGVRSAEDFRKIAEQAKKGIGVDPAGADK